MQNFHVLMIFTILSISMVGAQDFTDNAASEAVLHYDFETDYGSCSSGDTFSDQSGSGNSISVQTQNCVDTTQNGVRFNDPADKLYKSSAPVSTGTKYTWTFYVEPLKQKEQYRVLYLRDPDKPGRDTRPRISVYTDDNNNNKNYLHVSVRDALDSTGVFENVDGPYFSRMTHFAVTVEDTDTGDEQSTVEIYKNGDKKVTGQAMTSLAPDSDTVMSVGNEAGNNGRDVILDELYAFDRHLTDSEIQDLSNEIQVSSPNIESEGLKDTNINPSNDAELEVNVSHPSSSDMNITFYDSSHAQIDKIENVGNGTYTATWTGLSEDQTYNWYANVTDGSSTNRSNTASFTTIGVTLNWNDQSSNEDGFNIYSNASGSLQKVGEASENTESKTIYNSGLEFGKNTTYKIAAYNQYGESNRIKGYVTP